MLEVQVKDAHVHQSSFNFYVTFMFLFICRAISLL